MYIIIQKYIVEIHTSNIIIEKNHKADINSKLSLYWICDFFLLYIIIHTGFINFRYNNDLLYFWYGHYNRSATEQNVLNLALNCLFPNGCRYINALSFYELLYRSMS